ncbi:MAG: GTPase HflX [Bdellovibrionota bacterium]
MASVVGEMLGLRASEKFELEKLLTRRVRSDELIHSELARKAARLSHDTGKQLGLLIERSGEIAYVVVGSKERIYLPDLGRFRLDGARLRRLRLIVFLPDGEQKLQPQRAEDLPYGAHGRRPKREKVLGPEVPADLLTDLEKLRLDALLVVAVRNDGTDGPVAFACLEPPDPRSSSRAQGSRSLQIYFREELGDLDFAFTTFITELERRVENTRTRSFDTSVDHAVLVGAYTGSLREADSSMEELRELARTAGIDVLDCIIQRRKSLDPRTVIGKGKVEQVVLHCLDLGANMLVFDRELAPGQLRSITNLTELKVLDRSMLILDIFAQRAKSSEGRVQVELAQLRYSLPRLTESDTGLSRLTGGIGGRGPGETKLEIGRRRARDRITELENRIDKLAKQRGLRRERRQSRGVPVIAIVGYTNAGKSTLLNALTKGEVFVENKLFATLDPSSRRMRFPNEKEVIFVDTVGFIRELPKELVTAFRATLEEVGEADLVLHVADASSPELKDHIEVVEKTLSDLGFGDKPKVLALNKVDLLSEIEVKTLLAAHDAIAISATSRRGFTELLRSLQEELQRTFRGRDPGRFTEINQY